MVGRASLAEGLEWGLQVGDMTQEMLPGVPGVWAGAGKEWGLGTKEPRWAAQQKMEGSPRRRQWGSVGGQRLPGRGWGCFGVLTGTQPGSLESLSWEEVGREERQDERNVQEFQSP